MVQENFPFPRIRFSFNLALCFESGHAVGTRYIGRAYMGWRVVDWHFASGMGRITLSTDIYCA